MREYGYFIIDKQYKEDDLKVLEKVNSVISKYGIEICIQNGNQDIDFLRISYDGDKVKETFSRSAGRHRKYLDNYVSVEEIRERMKTESAEEVATSLGISRSTLFRKLKRAAVNEFDEII